MQGGGCAYWYISPGLAAGTHQLSAAYSGDKNNPAGTSAPAAIVVDPVAVNLNAACWNASFNYGPNYQCTVSVSSNAGSAQGVITYTYDGGTAVAVPISNGNAQFTISRPSVGEPYCHDCLRTTGQLCSSYCAGSELHGYTGSSFRSPYSVKLVCKMSGHQPDFPGNGQFLQWRGCSGKATGSVAFSDATYASGHSIHGQKWAGQLFHTNSLSAGSHTHHCQLLEWDQLRCRLQVV